MERSLRKLRVFATSGQELMSIGEEELTSLDITVRDVKKRLTSQGFPVRFRQRLLPLSGDGFCDAEPMEDDFKLRSAADLQLVVLPYATATPDELERLHKLMYKWTTEAEEILQKPLDPSAIHLHTSVWANEGDMVRLLLDARADKDRQTDDGQSALHVASQSGIVQMTRLLLEERADVNLADDVGRTPLHVVGLGDYNRGRGFAFDFDPLGVARLLIEARANIDLANDAGVTPLGLALEFRDLGLMRLLLQSGANKDVRDHCGRTLLHEACLLGDVDVAGLLLEVGVDKGAADANGRTALHDACQPILELLPKGGFGKGKWRKGMCGREKRAEIVRLLLQEPTPSQDVDCHGKTALHLAAECGLPEIASLLSEAGFDQELPDNQGQTPLDFAKAAALDPAAG